MPTLLNRADLLACLKRYSPDNLDDFASILGYRQLQESVTHFSASNSIYVETAVEVKTFEKTEIEPQVSFLRIIVHERFNEDEIQTDEPEWYRKAEPYQDNDAALQAPRGKSPPQPLLMPKNRLWPFLKLALGATVASHRFDLPRLVDQVAKAKVLRRLPKTRHKGWASQAQLIIDYDESLVPFWNDFNELRQLLAGIRGEIGLNILALPNGDPNGSCWQDTPAGWRTLEHYRPPQAGTPVLILSDLGCNDIGDQRRLRWQRFGKQLVHAACRAVALMPSPPHWLDGELAKLFLLVGWDRGLRPPQRLVHKSAYTVTHKTERDGSSANRLLKALGTSVRVEPALLRDARYLFPNQEMHVGVEFAAWNHTDVHPTLLAFYFQNAGAYKQHFLDEKFSRELIQQLAKLQLKHHAHLSPVIGYEEQLATAELLGKTSQLTASAFAERMSKTIAQSQGEISHLGKQWLRRMTIRQHASVWQNDALAVAWIKAQNQEDLTSLVMPDGLDLQQFAWAIGAKTTVKRQIREHGQTLVFNDSTASEQTGSLVGEILHAAPVVQVETMSETGIRQTQLYNIDQPIPIYPSENLSLWTDRESMQLDWLMMPSWASGIGRDEFGLYADLEYKGITQSFRWINPGTFLMGSPENEPERFNDELQHPVTLNQGYWLADSTCTQALWLAVMGKNPSRFKDDLNNPVETISWDDTQQFIQRLNENFPDLYARLPTEAEWENACRAGTVTPFSFGDNITTEQVNHDGNRPYANGAKGEYREKTVPVKSLPENPWGLYEMHGNVWEWCEDWFAKYDVSVTTNPTGAPDGYLRLLHGGSWINDTRGARSAGRGRDYPDSRHDSIGFRLALGRKGVSQEGQEKRQTATGSTTAGGAR